MSDELIRQRVEPILAKRRSDRGFMQRLHDRVRTDGPLLDRLKSARPCDSTALAVLGAVDPSGALLRCGDIQGHAGSHEFRLTWTDPPVTPKGPQ